jgi:hypothetical protein
LSMVCLEGHKNLWSRGLPPMAPCWHRKNAAGNGGNAPPAPAGNRGFKWLGKVGKMGYFQPINHIYIYIYIYIYIIQRFNWASNGQVARLNCWSTPLVEMFFPQLIKSE